MVEPKGGMNMEPGGVVVTFLFGFGAFVCFMLGLNGLGVFFALCAGIGVLVLTVSRPDVKGSCPHCGSTVLAHNTQQGLDCPGCGKRLLIRDKQLVPVE
jgi:DNA-directed RNA polymerase subunit RPC12/RpoP